jgi:hypothetical protein
VCTMCTACEPKLGFKMFSLESTIPTGAESKALSEQVLCFRVSRETPSLSARPSKHHSVFEHFGEICKRLPNKALIFPSVRSVCQLGGSSGKAEDPHL